MIIGRDSTGFVTVSDLGAEEALVALLTEAIMPNLVQTSEGTPAIVHGGPFANIAHGCNSIIATEAGLRTSDVVVTEAGFGADLGAEKFLDIKTPTAGLNVQLAVVVATLRALRYHGGQPVDRRDQPDRAALERGTANLQRHLENLARFGVPAVVAINRFQSDEADDIEWLVHKVEQWGVQARAADVYAQGGLGGQALAELVQQQLTQSTPRFAPLYRPEMPVKDKIATIAQDVYGAAGVEYGPQAQTALSRIRRWDLENLNVCVAKTQYSLSDNPKLLGRPEGFTLHVRDIEIARGAGYVVPLAGDIIRMPGLPVEPAAFRVQVDGAGTIHGIE
jgi:formate--tetrahydrofolate ligase